MSLSNLAAHLKNPPPLERWSPSFCGAIDMVIKRYGAWFYQGSPIGRAPLVTLFSTVIWLENDVYYLKTPVELLEIRVEDLPFLLVEMREEDGLLWFRTLQNEWVEGKEILFDHVGQEIHPKIKVRRNLYGRVNRAVFYELMARGIVQAGYFGIESGGNFFPLIKEEDYA
jgi:hypothetical protein